MNLDGIDVVIMNKELNIPSRTFVTSDSHLGHSNILKHTRRPADADERILSNWRRLIQPQDMVIHLGDVCWGKYKLEEALPYLPGHKILVRGNHDGKSTSYYLRCGFSGVFDALILNRIYLTHRPSPTLPEGCDVNIHGHLHNSVPVDHKEYPHCQLYSLEYENYEPRLLENFARRITKDRRVSYLQKSEPEQSVQDNLELLKHSLPKLL